MTIRRGLRATGLLAALLAAALSGPGRAAADGEITIHVLGVDDSAFPVVQAVITIEQAGRPVTSIEGLSASEGGQPATIVSAELVGEPLPLGVVLLVDRSGSMAGDRLVRARDSAAALVERLGPGDVAAVVSFASAVTVDVPPTAEKASLTGALLALRAAGDTALYDAVAAAGGVAARSERARSAVVLLSDGEDFGGRSRLPREDSLRAAAASGAVYYVVGLGAEADRPYLEELARRTGGQYFPAGGASDVPAVYAAIEQILRTQMRLTIQSTASGEERERLLELVIRREAATGKTELRYQSRRPPAPVATKAPEPVVVEPPPAAIEPPAPPAREPAADGSFPAWALLLALPVLGALAWLATRRFRRQPESPVPFSAAPATGIPARARPVTQRPVGRLLVGGTETPVLPGRPLLMGAAARADVVLPPARGVAPGHARIWVRDGRTMLHNLAQDCETRVNGSAADWVVLNDGDRIGVGPHELVYRESAP